MSKKKANPELERTLDFEKARDMTVGEAARQSAEIEAGVEETDSVLEKYIKQHRSEIEAGKYDAKRQVEQLLQENLTQEQRQESEFQELPEEIVAAEEARLLATTLGDSHLDRKGRVLDQIPMADSLEVEEIPLIQHDIKLEAKMEEVEEESSSRKRYFLYGGLVVALFALIGGSTIAYNLLNSKSNGSKVMVSSSSSSKKTSSSSENNLKTFLDLYNGFFTDEAHTSLKNSSFGNLDQLKAALDKLTADKEYETYKKQYEDLVKQVTAVQTINGQFQTAAITDGVLDANAQAKTDANFVDTTTGDEKLDGLLRSAVEQGRSQIIATPAPQTGGSVSTVVETVTSPSIISPIISNPVVNGVTLQRNRSRVPYNQAAIDDQDNPAWEFTSGILERILEVSRKRGYFTGDNYILEKVNIIKGNGYYNLFRSDGTYLFSINCKTGYFVGNGKGHADALDY